MLAVGSSCKQLLAVVSSWWWVSLIFSSLCSRPLPTPSQFPLECSSQFLSLVSAMYVSNNSGLFTFGCCRFFVVVYGDYHGKNFHKRYVERQLILYLLPCFNYMCWYLLYNLLLLTLGAHVGILLLLLFMMMVMYKIYTSGMLII